uniref:Coiled-coil-helix-coiled-coil-helix domain containing 5 n=1 Tax=Sus scrofa TaxID=9823 RepID=A0A8D1P3W1_PIG
MPYLSSSLALSQDLSGSQICPRCQSHPRLRSELHLLPAACSYPQSVLSHRQAALEVTARYCSRELEQYGQCVAAKPESWQRDCHHLKMSISQCTSSHPIIRQIRQACAEPFEAFEECLRQNEAAVSNCAEHVRRFLQCAEQVQPTHSPSTTQAQPFPAS